MDKYIGFGIMLFLLSMICERVSDFFKHYIDERNGPLSRFIKRFFKIGNTTRKAPPDSIEEDRRYYRILKINILFGSIIAVLLHADLFSILENIENPEQALNWSQYKIDDLLPWNSWPNNLFNFTVFIFGCLLTGLFISFGSKFWHDLLDLLFQVKNYRRLLADPETFKIDNINALDNAIKVYQSDFIKAAFLEARSKYMAIENVKAISLMRDEKGYYFDLTLKFPATGIEPFYQYSMADGNLQNIRVTFFVMGEADEIIAQQIDLSSKVFDVTQPGSFGTLGCLVKPLDVNDSRRYILTCCHNVVNPISKLASNAADISNINAGTGQADTTPIGRIKEAKRDHEIDVALIEIDSSKLAKISNRVPAMGQPNKPRTLLSKDEGNVRAFLFGAKSREESGTVTSLYCDVEITYSGDKFQLNNLIAISNNNSAITKPGDSGSCVLDGNNDVLGLVVAGNSRTTYIIPIATILNKLKVQLI